MMPEFVFGEFVKASFDLGGVFFEAENRLFDKFGEHAVF